MKNNKVEVKEGVSGKGNNRRRFLKMSGLAIAGSGLLLSCSDDDDFTPEMPPEGDVFDLGSGNLGILNYAYALEQLEAAFYDKVVNGSYYSGAGELEKTIFEDIYKHETIHRDFFKAAITGAVDGDDSKVLPSLEVDFSSVDFSSRASVLKYSQILEDTGVSAYNGAGQLITDDMIGHVYLTLAGKIVSVEARHASAIRDLIKPGTSNFASDDVLVDLSGAGVAFDKATPPADVLAAVGATGFIKTKFTADNLPTS